MSPSDSSNLTHEHQPDAIARRLASPVQSQNVSDAVLGGIDGCVTTLAVIAGALGGGFDAPVALTLGTANLFADGFSMAVSNYEAIKAENEHAEAARRTEGWHIREVPEGEREEIRQIFRSKGFEGPILERIVETITQNEDLWIETMLTEEYGLKKTPRHPIRAGAVTFGSFVSVGAVPLLPFFVSALRIESQFLLSIALGAVMFFGIGMFKSLALHKPVLRAGWSTLLTGGAAASLAYLTAYALQRFGGVS